MLQQQGLSEATRASLSIFTGVQALHADALLFSSFVLLFLITSNQRFLHFLTFHSRLEVQSEKIIKFGTRSGQIYFVSKDLGGATRQQE